MPRDDMKLLEALRELHRLDVQRRATLRGSPDRAAADARVEACEDEVRRLARRR